MNVHTLDARLSRDDGGEYVGYVRFEVDGHAQPYEMTLYSKDGREWEYNLLFWRESGKEEEIVAVEETLEEEDELFDRLVQTALDTLQGDDK